MCWQHHVWLYWHRARAISCETPVFGRVILHLDEFVERGHRAAHKALRQCGSGDRKHSTVTAAPSPWNCPSSQHQPSCWAPLVHTQGSGHRNSMPSVSYTVRSPRSTELCLHLQYSVALCCYTDALLSKHGFNTTVCLAWKLSVSCASKPVKNWCNWHQKRHGSLVWTGTHPKYVPNGEMQKINSTNLPKFNPTNHNNTHYFPI